MDDESGIPSSEWCVVFFFLFSLFFVVGQMGRGSHQWVGSAAIYLGSM